AYKLELPEELSRVHNTFHVSNLKKCHTDEPFAVPLDGLHLDDKLHFVEEPLEIVGREVKRLKRSQIPLVKVRWNASSSSVASNTPRTLIPLRPNLGVLQIGIKSQGYREPDNYDNEPSDDDNDDDDVEKDEEDGEEEEHLALVDPPTVPTEILCPQAEDAECGSLRYFKSECPIVKFQKRVDKKIRTLAERQTENKRKFENTFPEIVRINNNNKSRGKTTAGLTLLDRVRDNANVVNKPKGQLEMSEDCVLDECGNQGHYKRIAEREEPKSF
ncbi:hypothetical protein Tco_0079483, partial [Tanacetum coccineum]